VHRSKLRPFFFSILQVLMSKEVNRNPTNELPFIPLHGASVVSELNYLKSSEYGKYPRSEPQQGNRSWLILY
jgi:hypothetical protein